MQDKYVGDVGDFGKYLLLNMIIKTAKSSGQNIDLGINWYYVKYEKGKESDGRHIDYLNPMNRNSFEFRNCDPDLYDKLKQIIIDKKRYIREVEERGIIQSPASYYSEPLDNEDGYPVGRNNWFERSSKALKRADIIFLDPDNGIQTEKVKKIYKRSVKYVFRDEMEMYYKEGKTLIIYNHRDRSPYEQYQEKILSIKPNELDKDHFKVIRFHRVSVRDYIFLVHDEHTDLIDKVINELTSGTCSSLFENYPIN